MPANPTTLDAAATYALQSDPGYSAADLLRAGLARGVDPRALPTLRATSAPKGGVDSTNA